jgi:hypothetical protein
MAISDKYSQTNSSPRQNLAQPLKKIPSPHRPYVRK